MGFNSVFKEDIVLLYKWGSKIPTISATFLNNCHISSTHYLQQSPEASTVAVNWRQHCLPDRLNNHFIIHVIRSKNTVILDIFILHEICKRKTNWIGHILRRNCLLQQVIEEEKKKGGIEVTERRGRRRRKLLDELNERRGYSHLKEEALDRTMWTARFGRGFGPVARQTAK
jgi:hypothetical protein